MIWFRRTELTSLPMLQSVEEFGGHSQGRYAHCTAFKLGLPIGTLTQSRSPRLALVPYGWIWNGFWFRPKLELKTENCKPSHFSLIWTEKLGRLCSLGGVSMKCRDRAAPLPSPKDNSCRFQINGPQGMLCTLKVSLKNSCNFSIFLRNENWKHCTSLLNWWFLRNHIQRS